MVLRDYGTRVGLELHIKVVEDKELTINFTFGHNVILLLMFS